jgi:hypothetical protein
VHRSLSGVLQQFQALFELRLQTGWSYIAERDVSQSVQTDLMPALGDATDEPRVASGNLTDDEDGGSDPLLLDELQEAIAHLHKSLLLIMGAAVVLKIESDGNGHA